MALPDVKLGDPIVPAVPNLPLGPDQYERQYQDQFAKVLRLYFNQLTINLQQLIGVNTLSSTAYTVATLPSAVDYGVGTRTFVSDALGPVFAATVVGGGAVTVPVYSDGTNWRVG
jgi:hypothetical protein